ncbi:ATP-binding cassette domain-containing protein [Pontibacter qinzhouensis]|uniref:ATP-binding cassette domain-containing protein n=1 Tax=Pontibacter qinzhouensis TaxID=2603253 RepID=A0A5C8K9J5_9BACT|nr:ATP-binding cassette domain-containing protein [Pontibacter qinzhouensis]TXK48053.1 ATP-binding cassette domain-containing protein [Pontibacter qinzhouensis]
MPATTPAPVLLLQNITVKHLNHTLFRNLSFRINKGEQWALVGESGSGKTSLLQTIAGKYNVVSGTVQHVYYEEYLQQYPQHGKVFTHHNLVAEVAQKHNFRNLSSNITEFYYQQRYHAADSEDAPTVANYLAGIEAPAEAESCWTVETVISTFQLEQLLDKQLIKLSNGETKRLLLAAALLRHPRLLLLDNPLTGLDVQTRAEFNQLIRQIADSGISVIMATAPTEVPEALTHVAILDKGTLVEQLPIAEYDPARVNMAPAFAPDLAALQSLLSHTAPQVFETIVKMEQVHIQYAQKLVLDNINWHIRQGERWALLGHNGAGKTTLLSLINGDNPQSYAQKLTLFDRKRGSGETIWDIRKKIGFVSPEMYQYFPNENTCLEVVESGFYDTLGLFRKSEEHHAAIALRWMQLLEIEQEAHLPLRAVSASTQRLCLLARALIKNPPLLILDEPCQGLDKHQQEQFKKLLDAICQQSNTTLIYVTHYQQEIPESVNKVLQLQNGVVVS